MRLEIICSNCADQIAPGQSGKVYSRVCSVSESGVYEFECPNGHRTKTVLRTPKHEVLFTIGANALLDGYFRDAISSFAGALERYYEFCLRVISCHKEIDDDTFRKIWNLMENQSERQFGAFMSVWMIERGKSYTDFSKNEIENFSRIRNDAIHKGVIPTAKICLGYGQYVVDIIKPIEADLQEFYAEDHKHQCFRRARDVAEKDATSITVLSIFSVLDAALKNGGNLSEAIEILKELRKRDGITNDIESLRYRTISRVAKS